MFYKINSTDKIKYSKIRLPSNKIELIDSNLKSVSIIGTWSDEVQRRCKKDGQKCVMALYGRPTAPLFKEIVNAQNIYWNSLEKDKAIGYGKWSKGEDEYRERISKVFAKEYDTEIKMDNVIFFVSGRCSMNAWNFLINKLYPNKKIVLPLPYYWGYFDGHNFESERFLFVNTFAQNNFKLSASLLEDALKNVDPNEIGAFMFCDPHNPMGYAIGQEEWPKIAKILLNYKHALVFVDEAYNEMVFYKEHFSLLKIAPPELKTQIVLLRSATKGMSASGERMACVLAFKDEYLEQLALYNFNTLFHAPISSQFAYTYAIERLNVEDKIKIADFYLKFVKSMETLLKETNFNVENSSYKVEATFYLMGNFKRLIGLPLDEYVATNVYVDEKKYIENDIDIAYHLLFRYKIGFCPMSFFGVDSRLGLLRITCSFENDEFETITERLKEINKETESFQQSKVN